MSQAKPRYTVCTVAHGEIAREHLSTNKRRTAVREAARVEAANLNSIAHVEIFDRDGRVIEPSNSRWRREYNRACYWHNFHLQTRAVWG